ncbi:MAG: hypothetical protein NC133_04000 [Prevotella sp.]|nr:hypothetical protein [Prevotella sp.]
MRKDIFTKLWLLLVAVLGVCTGCFSFVFSNQNTIDSTNESVTDTILQPASNVGGGTYKFQDNDVMGESKRWYLRMDASGSTSGANRTVGASDNITLNITSASLVFCWGNNRWGGNNWEHVRNFKYFRLYEGSSLICDKSNWGGREDKSNWTETFWSGGLGEGSYRAEIGIRFNTGKFAGYWTNAGHDIDAVVLFRVDRTAPGITLTGVAVNGITKGTVTAKSESGATIKYGYSASLKLGDRPTSATENFPTNGVSKEGQYCLTATDAVENTSGFYRFTIDTTKPLNNFSYTLSNNKAYTNDDIIYAPTDNYEISRVAVRYKSGKWAYSATDAVNYDYNVIFNGNQIMVPKESGNGEWYFQSEDTAGNKSDEYCVVLSYLETFGNQERIRNSFISNYWYNIALPANIYGDEAGIYSAASYETALTFATQKEWDFRITPTPNGWRYVNSSNGNLSQEYTDKAELDVVVKKYAKSYIKDRIIAKNGTNNFNKIINDNLQIDNIALVRQWIAKPDFLPDDGLPIYMMRKDFEFVDPKFPSQTYVKIQMMANDLAPVTRAEVNLTYDVKVENQVLTIGNNSQGYYLVTEWDNAGNSEQYYVYIDLSAPTLTVDVVYGNNTTENITFNESIVEELAGTFRYLSLDMQQIADSVDQFVTMKINGRKLTDAVYIQGDELPVLDGVEYYGNYTIELYDRSGNTLTFVITIAGEAPKMTHSSLNSDTSCRLTMEVPDYNDTIEELKLYFITYEGIYVELTEDHKEVPVSASTLQYTLTTGGKYTIWYRDLFGREAYCTPVFYLKGLPTATLSGVSDGGITNRNVSLKYSEGNSLILYRVENGNKIEVPLDGTVYSQTFDETSHRYTAMLMANEDTTASYEFFLYKGDDRNLFVEYTFSIDCIIAPIYIYDTNGNALNKNAYSNQPFVVYWNETVTLRYYTDKTPGGETGAVRYTMGTMLTADGTYYFTLKDGVGNQETFTILLDTVVSYELGGEYVRLGEHEYIAKNDIQFSITESTSVLSFTSIPDVVNGGYITLEGVYRIWVTDAYGNSVEIKITIDRTAPVIRLFGTSDNSATNGNVQVEISDYATAYLVNSRDKIIGRVEDGQVFDTEGSYRIMATDVAGNVAYAVFAINRTIPYEANVVDGAFTTGDVTIEFLGELAIQQVTYNEELIDVAARYVLPGQYIISVVDLLGNTMEFTFTILPERVQAIDLQNLDDYTLANATFNGVVTILEIKDGQLYLDSNGKYMIKMENTKKNNVFEFNIEVDNIVAFDTNIVVGGLTTDAANLTFNETVKQIVTLNGNEIKTAKTYKEPGNYKITATDDLGNVAEITFTILPKRAREIHWEHLDSYELVLVTLDTETLDVEIVDNTLTLSQKGMYGIVLKIKGTDEMFSCGIEVDNTKPTVEIDKEPGSFKTTNASKENLIATLSCNGAEATAYTVGKKINGAGHYTLTITDDLGNENVYTFDITEPLNWAAYASIGGLGLLGAVALIVVFKARRRVKTR